MKSSLVANSHDAVDARDHNPKWRTRSISADIGKAVLFALVPLIVFAVTVLVFENRRIHARLDDRLLEIGSEILALLDASLREQVRTLEVLAVSRNLDQPAGLADFYTEARRVLALHPGWVAINLTDPQTARQLMNTARPLGAELPAASVPEQIFEVVRSGHPLISSRLATDASVIQRPIVAVRVPVLRDGEVKYVLSAALSVRTVQQFMIEQLDQLLPQLTQKAAGAALLDEDGRFVARLHRSEELAGQLASAQTRANMQRGPSGVYPGITLEGTETYGAYNRSSLTGWTLVVGVGRGDIDSLARESFWAVLAGAVISLLIATLLALHFGREAARRRLEFERILVLEADQKHLEQTRKLLAEREILLREIHHRVKNNLQTVSSLLRIGTRAWPGHYQDLIRASIRRIIAMGRVHEQLYKSPDLSKVLVGPYLEAIVRDIAIAEAAESRGIHCRVRYDEVHLDADRAAPLGLITTEALINAFKHGFPDGRAGTITVELTRSGTAAVLRVTDDGIGLPRIGEIESQSMGSDLIRMFANQIGGRVAMRRLQAGTEVCVEFMLLERAGDARPLQAGVSPEMLKPTGS